MSDHVRGYRGLKLRHAHRSRPGYEFGGRDTKFINRAISTTIATLRIIKGNLKNETSLINLSMSQD